MVDIIDDLHVIDVNYAIEYGSNNVVIGHLEDKLLVCQKRVSMIWNMGVFGSSKAVGMVRKLRLFLVISSKG